MTTTFRKLSALALAVAAVAGLSACGGGGGGGGTTGSTPLALGIADTLAGVLAGLSDTGLWSGGGDGGGGDSGSGDGGGGAGDGEFVKVSVKFPGDATRTGTVSWTVLRSAYGITGQTGVMTIQQDDATTGLGGYKVISGGGPNPSNFFVSTSGQMSGTLPLTINGSVGASVFNGVRFADAAADNTTLADYAGYYAMANTSADYLTGANPSVDYGVLHLQSNGNARYCDGTFNYTTNCLHGIDLVVAFDDPAQRNLLRITQAATQSTLIEPGMTTKFDGYAVVRKFGTSGVSMSMDVVGETATSDKWTGAGYASRLGAAISPAALKGAWNFTFREINAMSPLAALNNMQIGVDQVGLDVKARPGLPGANGCVPFPDSAVLTAGPVAGLGQLAASGSLAAAYLIQVDVDMFVSVTPGQQIGLARRYSTTTGVANKAPCLPS